MPTAFDQEGATVCSNDCNKWPEREKERDRTNLGLNGERECGKATLFPRSVFLSNIS